MPQPEKNRRPLEAKLRGLYATSLIEYVHSFPRPDPPAPGPPQVPAYKYTLNSSGSISGFEQVDGYRLLSYVGYLEFLGDGTLTGEGYSNTGGLNANPLVFTGDYTVDERRPGLYSGNFATVDQNGLRVEHLWIMSDKWRRLEFAVSQVLKGGIKHRQFVATGSLTRIKD